VFWFWFWIFIVALLISRPAGLVFLGLSLLALLGAFVIILTLVHDHPFRDWLRLPPPRRIWAKASVRPLNVPV
jgi:hypothetical protein